MNSEGNNDDGNSSLDSKRDMDLEQGVKGGDDNVQAEIHQVIDNDTNQDDTITSTTARTPKKNNRRQQEQVLEEDAAADATAKARAAASANSTEDILLTKAILRETGVLTSSTTTLAPPTTQHFPMHEEEEEEEYDEEYAYALVDNERRPKQDHHQHQYHNNSDGSPLQNTRRTAPQDIPLPPPASPVSTMNKGSAAPRCAAMSNSASMSVPASTTPGAYARQGPHPPREAAAGLRYSVTAPFSSDFTITSSGDGTGSEKQPQRKRKIQLDKNAGSNVYPGSNGGAPLLTATLVVEKSPTPLSHPEAQQEENPVPVPPPPQQQQQPLASAVSGVIAKAEPLDDKVLQIQEHLRVAAAQPQATDDLVGMTPKEKRQILTLFVVVVIAAVIGITVGVLMASRASD